ncbi:ATP-grasp domain-containing protein [Campylobacter iguaniorum]|uniref:ATP-grasp domain-containing protein n=1 Tax=Campylobacter iguaniorum TaxID=1244531 RepID=UPI00073A2CAA|nr:ATP-grasp domain-containing protein [Campylobacter iguaniorum]ALV25248.1 ATP-grasp domain-containing protein [Campylobacter iguaniorum]
MTKLNFPLVVKPSDRSAGRGVKKVNNIDELKQAFKEAKRFTNNGIVLVEEVLDGKQFSVETISSNKKHQIIAITEEFFREGVNEGDYLETQHLIPARIDEISKEMIQTEIFKILDAFDVKFGASHIELKFKNNKIKIIEVASRMGGLRNTMVRDAYDTDYNKLLLDSSLKKNIFLENQTVKFNSIAKFIYTKNDYEVYKNIKANYNSLITDDFVNANDSTNFSYASNLLDSKGFYYIKIPLRQDPDTLLKD